MKTIPITGIIFNNMICTLKRSNLSNRIKLLTVIIITTFSFSKTTFSQSNSNEYDGTYQIEILGRGKPSIPEGIELIIEEQRDKKNIVYYTIGSHARVRILPESEIKRAQFVPLKAQYVNVISF